MRIGGKVMSDVKREIEWGNSGTPVRRAPWTTWRSQFVATTSPKAVSSMWGQKLDYHSHLGAMAVDGAAVPPGVTSSRLNDVSLPPDCDQ
jgi:hypothetical protein